MRKNYIVFTFDKTLTALLRSFFILFFLFFFYSAFAQQAREYSFKHFSVTNGLASNTVSSVVQDADGFMWMSTTNGLQRYDGNNFITFKADENPSSIPSNHIYVLYKDKNSNLWLIADNNKVGIFDTRKFSFKEVYVPTDKRKFYMPQRLYELPTGEILLHKDDGSIFKYDASANKFIPANNIFPLPKGWKCTFISWDPVFRKYWLSCDSGLVQYNAVTKNSNYRGHNIDRDPVVKAFENVTYVSNAFTDPKGDVIFFSWPPKDSRPMLYRYSRLLNKAESHNLSEEIGLGYHEIKGFLVQQNGRIWVHGLPFFSEWTDTKQPFIALPTERKNEQGVQFDYSYQAYEDKEHNIWIASDNGVFYFNPDAQIFNTYRLVRTDGKPAIDAPVQSVAEADGKIFVGCWDAGIFSFDKNFNPISLPAGLQARGKQLSVWDMGVNSITGELWITLQNGGIAVFNPKTNRYVETYPEIFGKSTVRQIDEDTSGNFWFGTQSGRIIKWDYKKSGNDPRKGYEFICQTAQVLKVHFDYQGYVWVGTLGLGLLKIDVKTNKIVKTFTSSGKPGEKLFMDSPGDMTYHNDSTLIVSAGCVNIVNTKRNTISFISTDDGLPSYTAESVERDKNGIVWAGMTNGICRLNLEKKITTYYDRRDGIAYDKFNLAGVKELSDGRIVFYTDHNFLVFDPTKIVTQNLPPTPVITSFTVGGQSLPSDILQQDKKVSLKYSNTSIAIGFSALSYLQQRKIHYFYKLEGLDKDWIHTDHPIQAIFNYLPPGEYVFKVKSENADGMVSEEMASIPIFVRPPFWKTWWFYCLVILTVFLVLYLFDRERMKKMRSMQQLRTQIAGNLHEEVSYALNNINVLSEIAKIKADRNVEQSKEIIDQISDRSRYMIESMDDMLWSIQPENDNMKHTISRIKETTDNFIATYNTNIDLIVDFRLQKLTLDMKKRHELFFLYKETMLFVLQNNSCKQLFVNFNFKGGKLLLEILSECNNTFENFEKALRNRISKRMNNLKGSFDIVTENRSLSLLLTIPIK